MLGSIILRVRGTLRKCSHFNLLLLFLALLQKVCGQPRSLPLGILLDKSIQEFDAGLRFAIVQNNNGTLVRDFSATVNASVNYIDISNAFVLTDEMCKKTASGVFALLGSTNALSLSTIDAFTRIYQVPFITASPAVTIPSGNYITQLQPEYSDVIMQLLQLYKAKKIYYIYDDSIGTTHLQNFYKIIVRELPTLVVRPRFLSSIQDGHDFLRRIDQQENRKDVAKSDHVTIVIDIIDSTKLSLLLRQAVEVGMNRRNYRYILYTLGMRELDLDVFVHGGANVTGFQLVNHNSSLAARFIRDWQHADSDIWMGAGKTIPYKVALAADSIRLFAQTVMTMIDRNEDSLNNIYRGRILYNRHMGRSEYMPGVPCNAIPIPWFLGKSFRDTMRMTSFDGLTGPISFDSNGTRQNYKLTVMEVSLNQPLHRIGVYEDDKVLLDTDNEDHDGINRNETGIIITSIASPPFLMRQTNSFGHVEKDENGDDKLTGYCVDFAQKIEAILRAKNPIKYRLPFKIKLVKDGNYGSDPNKTMNWNGMIGELQRGEADMAIAPLTITSEREKFVDFSKPFMETGISIMIKKPETQKPGVFSFMDPFANEIWACTVVAYMGVSVVLFLVGRFSPYEWHIQNTPNGPVLTNDFTIANSLWFTLASFLNQGAEISPRSASSRIAGSCWWFFTLILISSYTANLAAFLTVERMVTEINSARALAEQEKVKYGVRSGGSTMEFFKNSNNSVYSKMWNFMSENPHVFVANESEGAHRVRNMKGQYAFLLESTMNEYFNQKEPCTTMMVGENLDSKGYGIATPIGSAYKDDIDDAVLKLKEKGALQKLETTWWYDKGECGGKDGGSDSGTQGALTLSNVAGIFYILILGLGISMVCALFEFLYKSQSEAARRKMTLTSVLQSNARLSVVAGVVGFHPQLLSSPEKPPLQNVTEPPDLPDTMPAHVSNGDQYAFYYGSYGENDTHAKQRRAAGPGGYDSQHQNNQDAQGKKNHTSV